MRTNIRHIEAVKPPSSQWSVCFSSWLLAICNIIDLAAGCLLVTYAIYMLKHDYGPEGMMEPILVLGGTLVTVVLLSWCGTCCESCGCLLTLSSFIPIPVAIFELIQAIVIWHNADDVIQWLRDHQAELHLTDNDLDNFKKHRFDLCYVLLSLFVMENVRLLVSRSVRRAQTDDAFHYRLLHDHEDREFALARDHAEENSRSKYIDLRKQYQEKYRRPSDDTMGQYARYDPTEDSEV